MERQAAFRNNGGVCRRFLNGNCRFGDACRYRHERPPPQICKHFQKGGCWFGDGCRYLHVSPQGESTAVAGRRSSEPNVSLPSSAAHSLSDRRGSGPVLLQSQQPCNRQNTNSYSQSATALSTTARTASVNTEGHSRETNVTTSAPCSDVGGNVQDKPSEEVIEGAAAAVTQTQLVNMAESICQSKEKTCGICMDKIWEKPELGDRMFGILPNCNHSFCLKCVITWRKTRDLGPDVVRTCPQCRVRSGFYIPNKYWVEGQEKETLIAAFKKKYSNRMCGYFLRHGRCPFKSDCLYHHGKTIHRRALQIPDDTEDYSTDVLNFLIALALIDDSDEDSDDEEFNVFDMPLYLIREYFSQNF